MSKICLRHTFIKKISLTFLFLATYLYTFSLYENPQFMIFSAETEYISTRSWYRNINFFKRSNKANLFIALVQQPVSKMKMTFQERYKQTNKHRNTTEISRDQQIQFHECPFFLVFVIFNRYPYLTMPWSSVYCYYIFFSIVISTRADKRRCAFTGFFLYDS